MKKLVGKKGRTIGGLVNKMKTKELIISILILIGVIFIGTIYFNWRTFNLVMIRIESNKLIYEVCNSCGDYDAISGELNCKKCQNEN